MGFKIKIRAINFENIDKINDNITKFKCELESYIFNVTRVFFIICKQTFKEKQFSCQIYSST